MYLSIIVPAYNEEKRLGSTLEELKTFMDKKGFAYEVLIVDDGSTDGTQEVSRSSTLSREGRLRVLDNKVNRGKGYSVKHGVSKSKGGLILFSDADLSAPINEFDKLEAAIVSGADIAIGSRSVKGSSVRVRQPFYRQSMGRIFNFYVRVILGVNLSDTQCGFKLFRSECAEALFEEVRTEGFAFDAEILFLARRKGLRVDEIGVEWVNSPESKVHPLFSSMRMFRDILMVRLIHK